jgi:hypothetical protein
VGEAEMSTTKGFFFTNDPNKYDPRLGENQPHGDGWANIHTWFDTDLYHWTSRISCYLSEHRIGVLEVDAQSEQQAIEAAIACSGNLE